MPEDVRPLLCAFVKVRNEILRGNIYRLLDNIERYVDAAVICDDASADGTDEAVRAWVRAQGDGSRFRDLHVPPHEQDFRRELFVKQRMLTIVHEIKPQFVLWMDGDEVLDAQGTRYIRDFCQSVGDSPLMAWRSHYTQFWRNTHWARTDDSFDAGQFIKLWRYAPHLSYDAQIGTHRDQFPQQIRQWISEGRVGQMPFDTLHYGNFGVALRWKCIQYWGGLGGVDRHLVFPHAAYRKVDQDVIPEGAERSDLVDGDRQPSPFTDEQIARIRSFNNLREQQGLFTVIVPAYNRADTLNKALHSLQEQTYDKWVAVVLDDGSTDRTPMLMRQWQDDDPRIFYCRYPKNRGGVAMNEIGMSIACDFGEWWVRLGSDDWFGPRKLEYDAAALAQHDACFGVFQVHRDGHMMEICNPPRPTHLVRRALLTAGFAASWANCAVRTSVLRSIREIYGNFCDLRLKNMEDFLVNARIARSSRGWVWRGNVDGTLIIDPPLEQLTFIEQAIREQRIEFEAAWNCVTTGASGNTLQYMTDENLTRSIITEENIKHGSQVR